MKHPVIVGTDLAGSSVFALYQGDERATREERPLVVVHVASPLAKIGTDRRANADNIRRKIQRHVAAVTGRREGAYRLVIARGLICSALARIATSQQGLLVVGDQMRTVHTRLFRTTAERIVSLARGSVLVARPTLGRGRVLVAIDHPLDARPALDFAIEEAGRVALGLTVVHCVTPRLIDTLAARVTGATSAEYSLSRRARVAEAREALRAELEQRNVAAELCVLEGEPRSTIPEFASRLNAQLVVVRRSHRPALTSNLASAVVRQVTCSVLVLGRQSEGAQGSTRAQPLTEL